MILADCPVWFHDTVMKPQATVRRKPDGPAAGTNPQVNRDFSDSNGLQVRTFFGLNVM